MTTSDSQTNTSPCLIVGIGVDPDDSAPLQAFFSTLPTECGLAFVLVTQWTGKDQTALIETIKTCTTLPVQEVRDNQTVAVNRVYFAPPTTQLVFREGVLQAKTEKEPATDLLFQSLAKEQGEDAIGILLGRYESDAGLKAIADVGGMTMALDSLGAQSDSSLNEGLMSGFIDHLLPPEDMPRELLSYARHLNALTVSGYRDSQSAQIAQHLDTICELLLDTTQTDFKHYKTSTLIRRIQHRLDVLQVNQVNRYVEKLRNDTKERRTLFKKLLVGVTAFFRDEESLLCWRNKLSPVC
ncbi:MAG: hypothetical protein HC808_00130 [Candidatus Competibacteraceae bacterium]|nr:hypothetical protein [Candidatus Competibacteraceae bacterium]